MFTCVLFPFYLFLHSDVIDLAYLKSLILKIILCIRMHRGGITAAPRGASCSSRDTRSQGCCHPSSPRLLLGGAGAGIAIVKQVREQRCSILKVLLYTGLKAIVLLIFWVKTDNFLLD